MAEREPRPALHRSVFARLLAIMAAMAASLLVLISGFYFVIVIPGVRESRNHLMETHLRAIAGTQPDREAAGRIAKALGMEIRFEGEGGAWTTSEDVPTLEEFDRDPGTGWWEHLRIMLHPRWTPRHVYYPAKAPNGRYLFAQEVDPRYQRAHTQMLLLLVVLMVAVFTSAYLVLRRALGPLRLLRQGVRELGEGRLDVEVPKRTEDEFGLLTDAFNRMVRRVAGMVKARDRLLLDVSHELRSPLTRMKVALEMLPDGDRKRSMAADVAEMEAMVTGLLEWHRLEDGGAALRKDRTDLVPLLEETVARHRDRGPGVRLPDAPESLLLDIEPDRVRMVLRNLIENAVKFSLPDSGPVRVAVRVEGSEAVVRVMDDGPGVPEGDEERLFEPFTRTDPSRSRRTGGYGLGLSICKRVMEAHGGSIAFEQREGRGATVALRFPLPAAERGRP